MDDCKALFACACTLPGRPNFLPPLPIASAGGNVGLFPAIDELGVDPEPPEAMGVSEEVSDPGEAEREREGRE